MIENQKVYIIAEAGVNHNGSLELAKKLVDVASEAGADAVKFQTFITENVISLSAPKAQYQKQATGTTETQFEMVRKLELNKEMHQELIAYCKARNIQFLSTPFDEDSVQLLSDIFDLPCIKIPSGEINNPLLLLRIAQTGKPVILSTGMSSLAEIEQALGVLAFGYTAIDRNPSIKSFYEAYCSKAGQDALNDKVTLLHCTTEYPAPFEEVNLKAMDTLSSAFGLPTGYSDHTQGIAISLAAVARGAVIIEKHFTLDKNLPGPDHQASLEPDELKALVTAIRQVNMALGSANKIPTSSEIRNKAIARKSLVAKVDIRCGDLISDKNLCVKRPGNGISPMQYWDVVGSVALKDISKDHIILPDSYSTLHTTKP